MNLWRHGMGRWKVGERKERLACVRLSVTREWRIENLTGVTAHLASVIWTPCLLSPRLHHVLFWCVIALHLVTRVPLYWNITCPPILPLVLRMSKMCPGYMYMDWLEVGTTEGILPLTTYNGKPYLFQPQLSGQDFALALFQSIHRTAWCHREGAVF